MKHLPDGGYRASQQTPASTPATSDFWRTAQAGIRLRQQFPAIRPIPRDSALPLSLHQERIWYWEQIYPSTCVHNILHLVHLKGLLEPATLVQSLEQIIQRHEILRTAFPVLEGQPVQSIVPTLPCWLPEVDLTHLSAEQQPAAVREIGLKQASLPFELTQPPLWRFLLVRLSDRQHVLIRVIHHLLFDGWSDGVFVRELAQCYQALQQGTSIDLLPLPIQYGDFAVAQRQWAQSQGFQAQLAYWSQQFADRPAPLKLPTDYERPPEVSYQGGCQAIVFPKALTDTLQSWSYQEGVSFYVVLLAAFKALLHCYTGQEDVLVCSPVAGRLRNETRPLLGYFNNVVALRTQLTDDLTLQDLLQRVSQTVLEANTHPDVPFQRVAELPQLAGVPLTRALLILQNAPLPVLGLETLTIDSAYTPLPAVNFDLVLTLQERGGQLGVTLQYRSSLFADASMAAFLENFQQLLTQMAAQPEQRLADLPRFASQHSGDVTAEPDAPTLAWTEARLATFVPPRDELEHQLVSLWERELGRQPISVRDNLFALGGDSLLAVRLSDRIAEVCGQELSVATLFRAPTIEQLANLLRKQEWASPWVSLMPIQPLGPRLPLFLCEGVGIYYPLVPHLGPEQPVYGLVAGGQRDEMLEYSTLEELAAHYVAEVRSLQPEGPYFLGGISWGGVAAYEMAQQLMAQGQEVGLLALFDTIRPGAYRPLPPLQRVLWHLGKFRQQGLGYIRERLQQQRGQVPFEQNLMPIPQNEAHAAMRQRFNQACQVYQPAPYPGRITLFVASDREDLGACTLEPGLGWAGLARDGMETYTVPGNHLGILQEPQVQVLGHQLLACLERAGVFSRAAVSLSTH